MPYTEKCENCPNIIDCELHTQMTNDNHFSGYFCGYFLPKQLRELCSGEKPDQYALFVSTWFLRGVFDYGLNGKPYNLAYHIYGFIPEIDFPIELNYVLDYLETESNDDSQQKFRTSVMNNITNGLVAITLSKSHKKKTFKIPDLKTLNYHFNRVSKKERC